jgi:hypothetical protein
MQYQAMKDAEDILKEQVGFEILCLGGICVWLHGLLQLRILQWNLWLL